MTNIKQRAHELLTCDELRGRVPKEVQALLRDIVALEPVGYARAWHVAGEVPAKVKNENGRWVWPTKFTFSPVTQGKISNSDHPVYDLGAPNDPA